MFASGTGQQTITIHIFPNYLSSKGNQTVKFRQLIKEKKINGFIQKSYKENVTERIVAVSFIQNKN